MERVRIADIAQELGLSTATVSNVIHGKTDKVSSATIQRVQQALEQHNYIPSMAGILLAQNASKIIGIFIHDHEKYQGHTLEDAFIASSLNHLSREIENSGQFMMVKLAKVPEEVLKFSSMWNMDGVVMIGFCRQDYLYLRNHMRIPFVVYDGFCEKAERFVNITLDNFDGGRQMGQLFRRLGHRRVLCISDNNVGVDRARMDGFRAGFGGDAPTWIIPMQQESRTRFYQENLTELRRVTGIFAVSDAYAIDLIHQLQMLGLRVPEDISVAGFDDNPLCRLTNPPLTTIHQDGAMRARIALESLRSLASGEETATDVMLPVTLTQRSSTAKVEF